MEREEDQPLWDLLGKATKPQVSPFFSRNVLRRIREQPARSGFLAWLNWRRLIPLSGLAAALVLGTFVVLHQHAPLQPVNSPDDDVVAQIDVQDYEVVADLDELLASDETNLWDDNSSL